MGCIVDMQALTLRTCLANQQLAYEAQLTAEATQLEAAIVTPVVTKIQVGTG
jgi:hypothetical protein